MKYVATDFVNERFDYNVDRKYNSNSGNVTEYIA